METQHRHVQPFEFGILLVHPVVPTSFGSSPFTNIHGFFSFQAAHTTASMNPVISLAAAIFTKHWQDQWVSQTGYHGYSSVCNGFTIIVVDFRSKFRINFCAFFKYFFIIIKDLAKCLLYTRK